MSCNKTIDTTDVFVNYKENKAVSISFASSKSNEDFSIHLKDIKTTVLGGFSSNKNTHIFTPIIPFSIGEEYQLNYNGLLKASFKIENKDAIIYPELLTVYPSSDTVPENMLKMYFVFSQPMQEVANSLDFITITDITNNKKVTAFLELQTELWNKEHTQLTLWLDPGRIKTDLIPNRELGLPILSGNQYIVDISKIMKDANGNMLTQGYSKTFYVSNRDSKKPSLKDWNISLPKRGTNGLLVIDFNEPLDAILAQETIHIYSPNNELVLGEINLRNEEQIFEFKPNDLWENGEYKIITESRLEDLAGNNLNHLFDVDLENNSSNEEQTKTKTILFTIL